MAEVKWIKIVTDIFDDEKILLIDGMPEHDAVIVIWFKLLCMAGKQNNGGVFMLSDKIAYTDEMLATVFRRPLATVRMALQIFEQFGMVEIINNAITIPHWDKYQNFERLEQAKEKNRARVAAYRQKQKQIAAASVSEDAQCNAYGNVTDHYNVMPCNAIDKDIDKDIDIDILSGKPDETPPEQPKKKSKTDNHTEERKKIVDYLNAKIGAHYKYDGAKTVSTINARINEGFTVDDFFAVIDKKYIEWANDAKMAQYLRPETLFGTKFEQYLNQREAPPRATGGYNQPQQNQDKWYNPETALPTDVAMEIRTMQEWASDPRNYDEFMMLYYDRFKNEPWVAAIVKKGERRE